MILIMMKGLFGTKLLASAPVGLTLFAYNYPVLHTGLMISAPLVLKKSNLCPPHHKTMNLPAASRRGIIVDYLFYFSSHVVGILTLGD